MLSKWRKRKCILNVAPVAVAMATTVTVNLFICICHSWMPARCLCMTMTTMHWKKRKNCTGRRKNASQKWLLIKEAKPLLAPRIFRKALNIICFHSLQYDFTEREYAVSNNRTKFKWYFMWAEHVCAHCVCAADSWHKCKQSASPRHVL